VLSHFALDPYLVLFVVKTVYCIDIWVQWGAPPYSAVGIERAVMTRHALVPMDRDLSAENRRLENQDDHRASNRLYEPKRRRDLGVAPLSMFVHRRMCMFAHRRKSLPISVRRCQIPTCLDTDNAP
jgi:hypothetical protein